MCEGIGCLVCAFLNFLLVDERPKQMGGSDVACFLTHTVFLFVMVCSIMIMLRPFAWHHVNNNNNDTDLKCYSFTAITLAVCNFGLFMYLIVTQSNSEPKISPTTGLPDDNHKTPGTCNPKILLMFNLLLLMFSMFRLFVCGCYALRLRTAMANPQQFVMRGPPAPPLLRENVPPPLNDQQINLIPTTSYFAGIKQGHNNFSTSTTLTTTTTITTTNIGNNLPQPPKIRSSPNERKIQHLRAQNYFDFKIDLKSEELKSNNSITFHLPTTAQPNQSQQDTCSICICQFDTNEPIKQLPKCVSDSFFFDYYFSFM